MIHVSRNCAYVNTTYGQKIQLFVCLFVFRSERVYNNVSPDRQTTSSKIKIAAVPNQFHLCKIRRLYNILPCG